MEGTAGAKAGSRGWPQQQSRDRARRRGRRGQTIPASAWGCGLGLPSLPHRRAQGGWARSAGGWAVKFPLRPPRLVWGWPRRHLGRVGGGSLGCDNGISPRRPGTAEQLAWGPAGGVRGADPLGSARMTRRRAHHLTEGETKAQTPGTAQTLTLASWETVPESPFPSPPVLPWVSNTWSYVGSGGALWACFPNWKVCPCCQRGSSSNFFLPGVPPTYPSRPGKISAEESHSLSEKKAQPRDARCTKDPFLSTPYFQPSPPGICP